MTAQNIENQPKKPKDRKDRKDRAYRVRTGLRAGCTNENISSWTLR